MALPSDPWLDYLRNQGAAVTHPRGVTPNTHHMQHTTDGTRALNQNFGTSALNQNFGMNAQSANFGLNTPNLLYGMNAQNLTFGVNALSQSLSGKKRPIPCLNGATTTLRSWLKLLALWEHESQIPQDKRGIKLLQSFPEGSQPRRIADTVPTDILISAQGYSAILSKLLEKYGPFLEATGPQAVDKFLFEGERGRGESFSSFVATKELARQEMDSHLGEHVSDRLCGRMLLKQANLNELQRELVSLKGSMMRTFDEVANMLRPLDRPEEKGVATAEERARLHQARQLQSALWRKENLPNGKVEQGRQVQVQPEGEVR
ncbi:unnamed protein product [Effrenium voratum]|nr:unnamed protein product [Effrenium voratum]